MRIGGAPNEDHASCARGLACSKYRAEISRRLNTLYGEPVGISGCRRVAEAQPVLADYGADALRRSRRGEVAIDVGGELGARDTGLTQAAGQYLAEPVREMGRRDEKMLDWCPYVEGPRNMAHPLDEVATALCASSTVLKGLKPFDQRVITIGDKFTAYGLMHSHNRR
jgi:hypothetical protein